MSDQEVMNYHLMRVSLAKFERRFDELTPIEQKTARREAGHSYELERKALDSPEARGLAVVSQDVEAAIEELKNRYESVGDFIHDLKRNHLTETGLREALKRGLKVEAVLEKVASTAPPIEEVETRAWYDRHPDKFERPETRTARHILITVNEAIEENTVQVARERIEDIRRRLSKTPEQFHKLALRHSECPSALEGGLLGRVPRDRLYPELDAILFVMQEGEISQVVKSENGFHILLCEKIHPAHKVPFAEASPKISEAMMKKRREKIQTVWLKAILKGSLS